MADDSIEDVPTSVLSTERCHLGEGPTYDASTDTAWWFDIRECRLFEHRFVSRETITHALPNMASALARIDDARQLMLTEHGRTLQRARKRSVSEISYSVPCGPAISLMVKFAPRQPK